jgi:hypothetical protein
MYNSFIATNTYYRNNLPVSSCYRFVHCFAPSTQGLVAYRRIIENSGPNDKEQSKAIEGQDQMKVNIRQWNDCRIAEAFEYCVG